MTREWKEFTEQGAALVVVLTHSPCFDETVTPRGGMWFGIQPDPDPEEHGEKDTESTPSPPDGRCLHFAEEKTEARVGNRRPPG